MLEMCLVTFVAECFLYYRMDMLNSVYSADINLKGSTCRELLESVGDFFSNPHQ